MKKLVAFFVFLVAFGAQAFAAETITIGVTPFPHKDIMTVAKPLLEQAGYILKIQEFTDYIQPNTALADGSLSANFFQHVPYLDNMNKERGSDLVWVAKVHIEPLGLYSKKISTPDALKKGDTVSVPSDPTNGARALRLLEAHGLITLKPGELVTARDVVANPKGIEIIELEAAQLPRTLQDVTASVINTNFAVEAGLTPSKDALVIESKESPYANVVVVRARDKDSPMAKALIKAVQSPEVKEYIVKELEPRGIVPAF